MLINSIYKYYHLDYIASNKIKELELDGTSFYSLIESKNISTNTISSISGSSNTIIDNNNDDEVIDRIDTDQYQQTSTTNTNTRKKPLYWRSGHYQAIRYNDYKLQISKHPNKIWLHNIELGTITTNSTIVLIYYMYTL